MKKCNKVYEIEAEDLRNGKSKYGLVVSCNLKEAKNMMAKRMQTNKRFIRFDSKKASFKKYYKLPIRRGVY